MSTASAELNGTCNCFALRKASRYLTAAYDQALAPTGLRATQFTILQKLAAHGSMTIGQLAEIIATDRTTMATNLKPLERNRFVSVAAPADDRRKRVVNLTDEGVQKFEEGLPLWRKVQDAFEENFGSGPALELRQQLNAILDSGFSSWATPAST